MVASRKQAVTTATMMGNSPKQQHKQQCEQEGGGGGEVEEQDDVHLQRKQQPDRRKQRKRRRRKRVRVLGTQYIFLLITAFVFVPILQVVVPDDRRQSFNEDLGSVVPMKTNKNKINNLRGSGNTSNSSATMMTTQTETDRIRNRHVISSNSIKSHSSLHEEKEVTQEIDSHYCLKHRGTSGRWYDDPELSRRTFYNHGYRSTTWFRSQWKNQRQKLLENHTLLQQKMKQQYLLLQKQGKKNISSSNISISIDIHDFDEVYGGNRYNWEDDTTTTTTTSHCDPIRPLTSKKMFCEICNGLNIERIMFVGDSTAKDQRSSLLRSIKEYNHTIMGPAEDGDMIVQCTSTSTTTNSNKKNKQTKNEINITLHRENLGPNIHPTMTTLDEAFPDDDNHTETNEIVHSVINSSTSDLLSLSAIRKIQQHQLNFGTEIPYCHGENSSTIAASPSPYICPWHHAYQNFGQGQQRQQQGRNIKRTLLVLNQGAHFHSVDTFSKSLDKYIEIFKVIGRPDDIVVYRSTVPGHKDCWDDPPLTANTITNMTYELFLQRYATTQYDWNLFDEYNQYARRTLEKEFSSTSGSDNNGSNDKGRDSDSDSNTNRIHFHYLNVYNMTVLRHDQHVKKNDCLHYTLPGPVDFWNHLLFTNLKDIMGVRNNSGIRGIDK